MAKSRKRLHLIVAKLEEPGTAPSIDNLILDAHYHKTNRERDLGEIITVNRKKMTVIVCGFDKEMVIKEVNEYIKHQNQYISIQKEYYSTSAGKKQLKELSEILEDLDIHFSN